MIPIPLSGEPLSGHVVYWNCLMSRDALAWNIISTILIKKQKQNKNKQQQRRQEQKKKQDKNAKQKQKIPDRKLNLGSPWSETLFPTKGKTPKKNLFYVICTR